MRQWFLALALLVCAHPAAAVLVEHGNGNTGAPAEDPGWRYVARVGGLNAVYLWGDWLVTAAHVANTISALSVVTLDGQLFTPLLSSIRIFEHREGQEADLAVFRITQTPGVLAPLPLASASPVLDTPVVMIARGRDRGLPTNWGDGGWYWDLFMNKRWGTNHVGGLMAGSSYPKATVLMPLGGRLTQSLLVQFDAGGSTDEAIVTTGDSGGAVLVEEPGGWELVGLLYARTTATGQPNNTSIYGNDSLAVDLPYYRDALLAVLSPCADGVDNDGDGLTDLADPQCAGAADLSELPACSDGLDNDADGSIDDADSSCGLPAGLVEGPDTDGDLIANARDNCLLKDNIGQLDADHDGYGNACDADYDNDGRVAATDFTAMLDAFGSEVGDPNYQESIDADGDGRIAATDFMFFTQAYGEPLGPSGLACAGSSPCY